MKKLYALLIILIVVYAGINFAYNGLDILPVLPDNDFSLNLGGDDSNKINLKASSFSALENFTNTSINDSSVSLSDSSKGITINVNELDSSINLSNITNELLINDVSITSNQTLNQNGVTVYLLYEEGLETYNADIYFSKNSHKYLITGDNIAYNDSDYFINNCKYIINSMGEKQNKISRF